MNTIDTTIAGEEMEGVSTMAMIMGVELDLDLDSMDDVVVEEEFPTTATDMSEVTAEVMAKTITELGAIGIDIDPAVLYWDLQGEILDGALEDPTLILCAAVRRYREENEDDILLNTTKRSSEDLYRILKGSMVDTRIRSLT